MTDKTAPISARIPVDIEEELKKRLKKEGKTLRKIITEYAEGVNTSKLSGIETMTRLLGVTAEEFIAGISSGLEDGTLTVIGKRVVGVPEYSLDNFLDACHDLNLDPQKTLDKVAGMIRKGAV